MNALKTLDQDPARSASAAQLRYVQSGEEGVHRRRRGKGWSYHQGRSNINDKASLARFKALAIPPAWKDVWICADPNGHLQATGIDAKGRKQYRYHSEWRKVRGEVKYGRMQALGAALPTLRERVLTDLQRSGMPKEKVLAGVVAIMERTRMRVGNTVYSQMNGSFGISTLRKHHVKRSPQGTQLKFRGKSGVYHSVGLQSERLVRLVMRCKELPGQRLFQYQDEHGEPQALDSSMVNEYLREITGGPFTSKDLRTWQGSTCFVEAILSASEEEEGAPTARIIAALDDVAVQLGNTRAVCKAHYVHPSVIAHAESGTLAALAKGLRDSRTPHGLSVAEKTVLRAVAGAA